MKMLVATIVIFILDFLVAYLPDIFAPLGYLFIKIVSVLATIAFLILTISNKGKDKLEVLSVILLIIFFFFSYRGYSLMRNYIETSNGLKEHFGNNYKIVGITKYKFEDCYNPYDYAFNVKLKDDSNLVFQGQYCSSGVPISTYSPHYNYKNYYVPYHINKFNSEYNKKIKYEIDEHNIIIIKFTPNEVNDVREFLKYLFSNDYDAFYQVTLYDIEKDKEIGFASSWNSDYESYFDRYR